MSMQVGDLVKVIVDNWGDSIPLGAVGIVTGFEKRLYIPAVTVVIPEHGECWIDKENLEIISKSRR